MTRRPQVLDQEPRHRVAVGAALTAAVAGLLIWALVTLPRGTNPLPGLARHALAVALPDWHTLEPVNEIVYGTRGFDTFGETFILLAAVIGISLVARTRQPRLGFIGEQVAGAQEQRRIDPNVAEDAPSQERARSADEEEHQQRRRAPGTPDRQPVGLPGPERAVAMSVPVRAATRFLVPVLTIAGIYLAAWGYSPGGGFPAGAVLLGVVLLAYAAYGYQGMAPFVRPGVIEPIELAFAFAIVAVAVCGLLLSGSLTANFLPLGPPATIRSGGILQIFSGSELVEVATGLTIAVFALLGMEDDWADEGASATASGRTTDSGESR